MTGAPTTADPLADFFALAGVLVLVGVVLTIVVIADIMRFSGRAYQALGVPRALVVLTVLASNGLGLVWYLVKWRPALAGIERLLAVADDPTAGASPTVIPGTPPRHGPAVPGHPWPPPPVDAPAATPAGTRAAAPGDPGGGAPTGRLVSTFGMPRGSRRQ